MFWLSLYEYKYKLLLSFVFSLSWMNSASDFQMLIFSRCGFNLIKSTWKILKSLLKLKSNRKIGRKWCVKGLFYRNGLKAAHVWAWIWFQRWLLHHWACSQVIFLEFRLVFGLRELRAFLYVHYDYLFCQWDSQ